MLYSPKPTFYGNQHQQPLNLPSYFDGKITTSSLIPSMWYHEPQNIQWVEILTKWTDQISTNNFFQKQPPSAGFSVTWCHVKKRNDFRLTIILECNLNITLAVSHLVYELEVSYSRWLKTSLSSMKIHRSVVHYNSCCSLVPVDRNIDNSGNNTKI